MNTMSLVLVALLYSTTLVNGNCPDDKSSTFPSSTSVLDNRKTTILPSPSVKADMLSPSSSPTPKDITRSSSPSPSPSPLTSSPLNEECFLPRNCKDWYDLGIRKSCVYPIYPDGKTQQMVYCDMKGTYCDGKGGWTRVGYLNMTESGATCPTGLTLQQYNNIDHKLCGRPNPSSAGCSSTIFSTLGISYYKVCGQVRGYQFNSPDGFLRFFNDQTISSPYVDGISLTHGQSPRQHIWTYAADHAGKHLVRCPCATSINPPLPSFVGNHYYCEAGTDILWDGKDCPGSEASCCKNTKQPWFYRELDNMILDNIELRLCGDEGVPNEDTPLDIIELYVQ